MLPNPQETADLVTFTEEVFSGKLRLLCSEGQNDKYFSNFKTHVNIRNSQRLSEIKF